MTEHRIGTQDERQSKRHELLKQDKAVTRRGDELAPERRKLPSFESTGTCGRSRR